MVDEQSQHDSTLNERDFLIEINSRMQVPDRIYAQPNSNREFFMAQDDDEEEETRHDKSVKSKNSPVSKMYLPDTIVMSDDNKYHKGIRLNSLEDDDFGLLEDRFNRVVTTIAPAETLTFGQHRNRNDSFIHKQEKDVDFFDEDFEAE